MTKGKGRGWHGDPERHSKAARGIPTNPDGSLPSTWPRGTMASKADIRRAEKLRDMIYATEETASGEIEDHMEGAIGQIEEITYGHQYTGVRTSKGELKDVYNRIGTHLARAIGSKDTTRRFISELDKVHKAVMEARDAL